MFIPLALALSPEQEAVRQTLARLCGTHVADGRLRSSIASERGYDEACWRQLVDTGLTSLLIADAQDDAAGDAVDFFVMFREMGRVLLPSPAMASVALARNLLLHAGNDDALRDLLPRMGRGELLATVALCEEGGDWALSAVQLMAQRCGSGYRLTGTKHFVLDGQHADLLLVVAREGKDLRVFGVDGGTAGMMVQPLETLDLTRRQARVTFEDTPAELLSDGGDCTESIAHALRFATLAVIAEQVGGAEQVMSNAIEYAKTRMQFGRPIGSFQAIQHKLSDMACDLERMVSAGWHAAVSLATGADDAAAAVNLAKAFCSEAYFRMAVENIQIHGGIGFTWEHDAHLYFRRAKSDEFLLGSSRQHRAELFGHLAATLSPASRLE